MNSIQTKLSLSRIYAFAYQYWNCLQEVLQLVEQENLKRRRTRIKQRILGTWTWPMTLHPSGKPPTMQLMEDSRGRWNSSLECFHHYMVIEILRLRHLDFQGLNCLPYVGEGICKNIPLLFLQCFQSIHQGILRPSTAFKWQKKLPLFLTLVVKKGQNQGWKSKISSMVTCLVNSRKYS